MILEVNGKNREIPLEEQLIIDPPVKTEELESEDKE